MCFAALPALAHSALKRSTPAAGAVARAPVAEIRLSFSQGVEPALSAITITRGAETILDQKKPEGVDASTLILRLDAPLPAGRYTVDWRALSVDTHVVRGKFSFEVK